MAKLSIKPFGAGTSYGFFCPGCKEAHRVHVTPTGSGWSFNGDLERPTFSPSVLVRSGHYIEGGGCWCGKGYGFECYLCHSFIRDGRIEFLGDCSHKLAGQTVDLPDMDGGRDGP